MHALISLRGLPPAQRDAWKELFMHYIFNSDGSEAAHLPPGARRVLAPLDDNLARALRSQIINRINR
jgi:hypothetical protein